MSQAINCYSNVANQTRNKDKFSNDVHTTLHRFMVFYNTITYPSQDYVD